ncbi:MAG TPA: PP2C family protein-serine/threonine phosphatase, partial [Acidobacteriaceae bacterium]|nr:PP2C family protein-serine/threonine phosphatase [Acidobacteriaceae bacterium]
PNFVSTLMFTLVVGNFTNASLAIAAPLFSKRRFPMDWIVYLALLVPIGAFGSLLSTLLLLVVYGHKGPRVEWMVANIEVGTLFSLLAGISIFAVGSTRDRLEARNRQLQNEVQLGAVKLQAQEAELQTAHDIQAHLLPAEIPQIARFQISCAWQPAQSVGGDYFDVLAFSPRQVAICLADVSGKGISAALLMANLQAAFRAFASEDVTPGPLCGKLNRALCSNIGSGKFVTLFYGVLDNERLTFHYENAGHSCPLLLRGSEVMTLQEGGTVLGIFAGAQYQDRSIQLAAGDCLILTTDGVTEAANGSEEEFGEERLTASAFSVRTHGANAIRSKILEDVTRFCNGKFQDDASLIVITVDG